MTLRVLLDTSVVVDILRGSRRGVRLMEALESEGATFHLPSPVLYELAAGFAHIGSRVQQAMFDAMSAYWQEAPFTDREARAAGELQAQLLAAGEPGADVDVMVAATALANRFVLASVDGAHEAMAHAAGIGVRTK
jgi:predicted nucleic acid-binding protein